MNKWTYLAIGLLFGWITYKFATVAPMGDDNGFAMAFSGLVSVVGFYGFSNS